VITRAYQENRAVDLELADSISIGFLKEMKSQKIHPATALIAAVKIVSLLSVNCGVTDSLIIKQLREVLKDTRIRFEKT
jgi:hypothetical protein